MIKTKRVEKTFHSYRLPPILSHSVLYSSHSPKRKKKSQLLNWLFRENKYFISRIENENKTKEERKKERKREKKIHVEKMPKVFETICIWMRTQ